MNVVVLKYEFIYRLVDTPPSSCSWIWDISATAHSNLSTNSQNSYDLRVFYSESNPLLSSNSSKFDGQTPRGSFFTFITLGGSFFTFDWGRWGHWAWADVSLVGQCVTLLQSLWPVLSFGVAQ